MMKLGILSDLHIDLNDRGQWRIIPTLAQVCCEEKVDYLLIAGDLTNDYKKTLNFLEKIEESASLKCLFVPGNHDIWNLHYKTQNSWEIYRQLEVFSGNLTREPFHLNEEWVVIGDMGWYDFSFGNPRYSTAEFEAMEHHQMLWQDGLFAIWGRSSQEVCKYFYEKLQKQLEEVAGKKIILMTHIVPHSDFIVRSSHEMWQYFNAFLGSKAYGELAQQYGVKYYIFGHVHYRFRREINGVTWICNSLGYTREWRNPTNLLEEIRRAFKTIEI